jgi:hypothetical protein
VSYGGRTYAGTTYAGGVGEIELPPPPPLQVGNPIELLEVWTPTDFQLSSGGAMEVPLPTNIRTGDLHILHIAHRGGGEVTLPSGWVKYHAVSSGIGDNDISEDVWAFPIAAGVTPPSSVIVQFSREQGEKWLGGQTWRYVDLSVIFSAIDGVVGGEPGALEALNAFIYAYSNVLQALLRSELALEYAYAKVIQNLKFSDTSSGYAYAKIIQFLESKGGFTYAYSNLLDPLTNPGVVQYVNGWSQLLSGLSNQSFTPPSLSALGVQPGDLVLAAFFGDSGTSSDGQYLDWPAGWNVLYQHVFSASTEWNTGYLLWKYVPDPVPTNQETFTFSPEKSWDRSANIQVFRNVDQLDPFHDHQRNVNIAGSSNSRLPAGMQSGQGARRVIMAHHGASITRALTVDLSTYWNVRHLVSGTSRVVRYAADALLPMAPPLNQHYDISTDGAAGHLIFDVVLRSAG